MALEKQKIDKLSPEQEAQIPRYLEEYLQIGLSTDPCDRPKAEKAVRDSYKFLSMAEPLFFWAESPFEGAKMAAQLAKGNPAVGPEDYAALFANTEVSKSEIAAQADMASYGSFESYWVAFYAFISEQLPIEPTPLIEIAKDIVKNCGVYWTFEDVVVITNKPKKIVMDNGNLSNPEGKAIEYRDNTGIYAYNGTTYNTLSELKLAAKMGATEQVSV